MEMFGGLLRKSRTAMGMTYSFIARRCKVKPSSVVSWENTTNLPEKLRLKKIALAYGIGLERLTTVWEKTSRAKKITMQAKRPPTQIRPSGDCVFWGGGNGHRTGRRRTA